MKYRQYSMGKGF